MKLQRKKKKLAAINLSAFVTAWKQTRPSVGRRVWNDDEDAASRHSRMPTACKTGWKPGVSIEKYPSRS